MKKSNYEKAILSAKKEFITIAGKEVWERESRFALAWKTVPSWELNSVKKSMIDVALTGVTLNSIFKEAYFSDRDGKCVLDFTYKGLIKIATSDGTITSLSASVVYAWDKFSSNQGTKGFINHEINLNPPKDPDEIARDPKLIWEFVKCAYAIATYPNGHESFIILPKWKLLKTWNLGANAQPINQAFPEDWQKKTAVRSLSKMIPTATRLVMAVSIMNEHEGIKSKKSKPESQFLKRMKKKKEK